MSYKEFSAIYDKLMYDVPYEEWIDFILLHSDVKPGDNILDIACGTGNITSILAQRDFRVTAFDKSEDMLAVCYEKTGRNPFVSIYNFDMLNFHLDKKYKLAVCVCDGVNYIYEDEKLREFFKKVYSHLTEKGKFIFDVSSVYKLKNILGENTLVQEEQGVFYVWENRYDEKSSMLEMEINFFTEDGQNCYSRITEIQKQRAFEIQDITEALESAGFDEIKIYDNYNERPVDEKTQRITFCCVRR